MKSFVINLERRKDRLKTLNIPFRYELFKAVDGTKMEDVPFANQGWTGCYYSHKTLLEHVQKEKLPYAIILEDDVVLCQDFVYKLQRVIDELPFSLFRWLGLG